MTSNRSIESKTPHGDSLSNSFDRDDSVRSEKSPPSRGAPNGARFSGSLVRKPRISVIRLKFSLSKAVGMLRNNETKLTTEVKGSGMKTSISYPAELIGALRGMFPASKTYRFELHNIESQTTTAGGGFLGAIALSPSVTSYGEWTALSALFDEVKAESSKIHFVGTTLSNSLPSPIMLALDEQNLNTPPATYLQVARLAESKSFHSLDGDNGSGRHSQSRFLCSRSWCNTATPYSQSPVGGCIGAWVFANGTIMTVSTTYFIVDFTLVVRLRCRA
jgi:hypothetical protein